jgi:AAHS family 4-hydroxybenzoate transporter-like MFS transporter
VGRIGAILGPILGGVLISQHVATSRIFLIIGVPPICVAIALSVLNWFRPEAAIETGQIAVANRAPFSSENLSGKET